MSEYCIRGETKEGKVRTLRRGFVSRGAAEDHPVQLSLWKRVWVEPFAAPPVPSRERPPPRQDRVDLAFETIVEAVLKGERCPENGTRNMNTGLARQLAASGRIKIEVFARNFRVVTILTGPHAGKKTAPPPYQVNRPKLIITAAGKHVIKKFMMPA